MTNIVAKIMVELISILSLAKKHIHRGRLSERVLTVIKQLDLTLLQSNSQKSYWGIARLRQY